MLNINNIITAFTIPIYKKPSLGKGSPIVDDIFKNDIFKELVRNSYKREGKLGKIYTFFYKHFTPRRIKIELCVKIKNVIQHLENEKDIKTIIVAMRVLSKFLPEEFDRKNISNSLKDRLIRKISANQESDVSKIAKLSTYLGIGPILNGKGAHSSKIYFNLNYNPIAIFKSGDLNKTETIKRKISILLNEKKIIHTQDYFLPISDKRPKAAMISEKATYMLSEFLGLNLVPTTEVIEMDGEKGSFQHFVQGYREANEVRLPNLKNANKEDLTKFQMFAIFDFLIGSLDRKGENWLVRLDPKGHINDIKMIDNGNNFAADHVPPSAMIAKKNQYKWRKLPLAKAPLTEGAKAFIATLTEAQIKQFLEVIKKEFKEDADAFFSPSVLKTLHERLEILRSFQEGKRNLVELASYSTPKAFANLSSKQAS